MAPLLQKLTFALYALAGAAAVAAYLAGFREKYRWSLYGLTGAWLANGAYLGVRWYIGGRAPMSNMYESLTFMVWCFAAAYLAFRRGYGAKLDPLAPWTALVCTVALGGASFLPSDISPLMPALRSNWLFIHVSTVMAGYGALLLAFLCALYFLFSGAAQEKTLGADALGYRSSLAGFWLLSLGIITGAVWANSAWGAYWSWDPKETWSLITWLYYAVAIHLRRMRGWREGRYAHLMVWGFALVMFTYFGVNYLLPGLHSYA
jgi:ABC-type transport system involved in cytochrome c biogenesis permease subunit